MRASEDERVDPGLLHRRQVAGRDLDQLRSPRDTGLDELDEALNRSVDHHLPRGTQAIAWHRVMNEAQMILHGHPVNEAREARGEAVANSIWLWGGGTAPPAGSASFERVWSNDLLARALARNADVTVYDLPDSADAMIAEGGNALAVVTALRDANDLESWCAAIERCEQHWFAPCRKALQDGRMGSLTIVAPAEPQGRQFTIAASHRWRWWRRAKAISAHV